MKKKNLRNFNRLNFKRIIMCLGWFGVNLVFGLLFALLLVVRLPFGLFILLSMR